MKPIIEMLITLLFLGLMGAAYYCFCKNMFNEFFLTAGNKKIRKGRRWFFDTDGKDDEDDEFCCQPFFDTYSCIANTTGEGQRYDFKNNYGGDPKMFSYKKEGKEV